MKLYNWQAVLTEELYERKMSVSCLLAANWNNEHKTLLDAANFCKNLAVLMCNWLFIGKKPNWTKHSLTMVGDPVRKSFIKIRVKLKSNEWIWRESKGHDSHAYNKIGRHLVRSSLMTACSDAKRPTLLNMALKARKNDI